MSKQKILLFGYWENNLGDDLFLEIFSNCYPDEQIYILTRKEYKKIYSSENIRIITYDSFLYKLINKICRILNLPDLFYSYYSKRVNAAVCLGGSLFMETKNWNKQFENLSCVIKNCEYTYVIGSNFGPFYNEKFLQLYKELFSRMTDVCFRDKLSYKLFADIPNIRFAPDVVLNFKYKDNKITKLPFNDYYAISVIDLDKRNELSQFKQLYEKKIAEIASEIIDNGSNVVFISFCNKEGDLNPISTIQTLLRDKGDRIAVHSHTEIEESLSIIYNSNGVIATRLHAMILAFLFNKPVFPIIYSEKMRNIIIDYSFNNEYTIIHEIKTLNVKDVVKYLEVKPNIPRSIIELAKEQFVEIDNFLGKGNKATKVD